MRFVLRSSTARRFVVRRRRRRSIPSGRNADRADLDDDNDGKIDWDGGPGGGEPDPQCVGMPWRLKESASKCGLGAELALVVPLLAWLRRRR